MNEYLSTAVVVGLGLGCVLWGGSRLITRWTGRRSGANGPGALLALAGTAATIVAALYILPPKGVFGCVLTFSGISAFWLLLAQSLFGTKDEHRVRAETG